ncbi:hypothetical protein C7T94_17985 [Pedobacter yulinensis]|uniref:SIMPL domain-containing protein n=1 Tax=Pedobacter yulinensis TaxID=2126353 RepID=A0A2T3HHA5_9SPHI|nr:hypothetical protein [Pedobacter yulinensis]PST81761.1 hypothetical protein C7T94_17985 [Pedobacter yulinensis]
MKKLLLSLCLCSALLLTGCFQIIEEINLRADGSGTATLTINLSQSRSKVASLMLLDSVNGYKVPSQQKIRQEMAEAAAFLKQSPGISNVKSSTDFNNYIATISFGFRNVANISNLSKTILNRMKIRSSDQSSYSFNTSLLQFKRNYQHITSARTEYAKLKSEDKAIFKDATYTAIYRFEQQVASVSNRQAAISRSGKAVMLRSNILALIDGKTNISNTVQLKK